MATANIGTSATLHQEAYRRFGEALHAVHARLVASSRRRRESQLLRVLRELDHPGVLADMQTAAYQSRGSYSPRS